MSATLSTHLPPTSLHTKPLRSQLNCVATVVFSVRLLHTVAFPTSRKVAGVETIRGPRRLMQKWQIFLELRPASPGRETKVILLKTQLHAVNARWKRVSQRSLKDQRDQLRGSSNSGKQSPERPLKLVYE
jgi:hypothetical protein